MRQLFSLVVYTCLIHCASCTSKQPTLFSEVPSAVSNVSFKNDVKEDQDFNILTYEYLYNGGGVAAGDLNNDGFTDLFFTGNMVSNKLYLNKGNMVFEDITTAAGVKGRARWKTGAVMADVNGDGLLDIYVCYSGPGKDDERRNELYINQGVTNGVPVFTEQAKEYGLDAAGTFSTTASFFDMDNDGDLDMFLVNHGDMFFNPFFNTEKLRQVRNPKFGNRLYRNDNGKFVDISEQANISGSGLNFGLGIATSDINNDGWTDIYVTNDYDERDFLYLNNHDGTFREVLQKAAGHISEFAMGTDIADYNNDMKADVMVLDMLPEDNYRQKLLKGADGYDKYNLRYNNGYHKQQMRNTLQLNNGNDTSGMPLFSEAGQLANVYSTDWSWAPLFADFDNDGWKDLFISNGINKDITSLDFVKYTSGYSNNFSDTKSSKEEMWQLIKEMPSTKLTGYFFKNNHDLTFSNANIAWGLTKKTVSNGSVYADLDNDGDLDLVMNCLNDKARILQNNTNTKDSSAYIQLQLKGTGKNTLGIGAKVFVKTAHNLQMQEHYLTRGFQSSVDPIMHFGTAADTVVESIQVQWPGGKTSLLKNIKANQRIIIDEAKAINGNIQDDTTNTVLFHDVTAASNINFMQKNSAYVDFKTSPLLPYQISKTHTALTKGDVNNDGLEDLFIGAASASHAVLYLQEKNGRFSVSQHQPWQTDNSITMTDAVFFDADGDGDQDLYVVSGGTTFPAGSKQYQDVLYINNGKGNFSVGDNALPPETQSGSCVRVADVNKDGRPDLFIGGATIPGSFPKAPPSLLLLNTSQGNHVSFVINNTQKDSTLSNMGMVTDAGWADINNDGWPDLVAVGICMPVTILENDHGTLINKTKEYGCAETNGWWSSLLITDIDEDGDSDLIIGNMGLNTQLKASPDEPLTITYADFNNDGMIDPMLCYYNQGKSYPYCSRDELFDQLPLLHKQFGLYKEYAVATLDDMFSKDQLRNAKTISAKTMASVCLINNGHKKFNMKLLPLQAQLSMINGIIAKDIDNDGKQDLIIAGNFYPMRVQLGPLDAGMGLVLKGDGTGNFSVLPYTKTGLCVQGDVRSLIPLNTPQGLLIIAGKSGDKIQVIKLDNSKLLFTG